MKRTIAVLAGIALCGLSYAYSSYEISNKGTWPKSWPQELEQLRKQSRTITGGLANLTHYEIPFDKADDFESAWPHILKVKSKGAPVILVRGPNTKLGPRMKAGVRIYVPPVMSGNRAMPEAPLPGQTSLRERWLYTTFVELVVDGDMLDMNRIPLPEDSPIIDQRFDSSQHESPNRSGGQREN
jgi:hypothetical protein